MLKRLLPLALLLALGGCQTLPQSIQTQDDTNLATYEQVASKPDMNKDKMARWGGVIAQVNNEAEGTMLELVHFPVRSYGRPIDSDESVGRFRVRVDGFLDPMVYQEGRSLTVLGTVLGIEQGQVGEQNYSFPVLDASGYHLWKEIDRVDVTTVDIWPYGFYGWHLWPYHTRVIRTRHVRHDSHRSTGRRNDHDRPSNASSSSSSRQPSPPSAARKDTKVLQN